ncbi:MAG: hypothetical protein V4667_03060 [Bacteroidota bacterium]
MKIDTKESLFITYSNVRRNFEIRNYVSQCGSWVNKKISEEPILFHWLSLLQKDLFIEINKIVKITKNGELKGFIGKAIDEFNNPDKEKLKQFFFENENMLFIQKINNSRNKYYAHLDPDYQDYIKPYYQHDLELLLLEIEKTIIAIYGKKELIVYLSKIPSSKDYNFFEKYFLNK